MVQIIEDWASDEESRLGYYVRRGLSMGLVVGSRKRHPKNPIDFDPNYSLTTRLRT
jgi:hypothetical protein